MSKFYAFLLFFLLQTYCSHHAKAYFITLDIFKNPTNNCTICLCGDYHEMLKVDNSAKTIQQLAWIKTETQSINPQSPIFLLYEGRIPSQFENIHDNSSIIKQVGAMHFDLSKISPLNIENRPLCFSYASAFFNPRSIPMMWGFHPSLVKAGYLPNLFDFFYSDLCTSVEALSFEFSLKISSLEVSKRKCYERMLQTIQYQYETLRRYVSDNEPKLESENCLLSYASNLWIDSINKSCHAHNIEIERQTNDSQSAVAMLSDVYSSISVKNWEEIHAQLLEFTGMAIKHFHSKKVQESNDFLGHWFDRNARRFNILKRIILCFAGLIEINIFLKLENVQKNHSHSKIIVMAGFEHMKMVKSLLLKCGYNLVRQKEDTFTQEDIQILFDN